MSGSRILVVGPAWVGDMVMAQSLFRVLKNASPDTVVDVVAPGWSAPLVARMPEVSKTHVLPMGHGELGLGVRRRLGRSLLAMNYDQAIVLPRSFKAALVPFHARIPVRTGYRGEMRFVLVNDRRPLDRLRLPTTVSRYVNLGMPAAAGLPDPLPLPRLRADTDRVTELLREFGLNGERPVVLMPGAEYGPAKQWPAARFAALAATLTRAGREVWILGSQKERQLGETVAGDSSAHNLCGRTELTDVIDLLSRADAAVSNDSGLMHIAAATGCRVVAIYGSSSPEFTPPLTDKATILTEAQPCSPCFERTCRFGHYRCLTGIEVGRVAAAIASA